MNALYIVDLILVSLWGLFALCNFEPIYLLMFPFIIVRIASTFSLQLRERKSIILILTFILGILLVPAFYDYSFDDVVIRPFTRMYDYGVMFLSGESTLLEGAWHYTGNHGDLVADPGLGWKVFTVAYLLWLILMPLIIYLILIFKKKLRSSRWNWKKLFITYGFYCIFSSALLLRYKAAPISIYFLGWLWLLSVMLIPILSRLCWKGLTIWCRRYIIIISLFSVTIVAGITMEPFASLIAMVVSLPLFFYFVGYKWSGSNNKNLRVFLYMLIIPGIAFWTAQYGADETRIIILMLSFGLTGYVSFIFWNQTRKTTLSITILVVCSFILPSIALGYNQFICFGAKRLYNFKEYRYSPRGLIMVRSGKHYAIRDRFGYITPEYEQIESMGNSSKPFVKFKHNGFWGVYDLERQSVVVEPEYNDILPYDKNSWRLMDEFSVRYGCHDFFVTPGYYYRYRECGKTSDCPFIHGLEDELPLKYDCDVTGAKYLDYILTEMMTKLWQKPDSISHADFYYDWTCEVNGLIDNLQSKIDVFDDDGDITNEAMQKLEEYIDPGCGGSQMEMNATSYVLSAIENYRMIQSVQDLEYILSPIDIRREYTLFNEFMSAYEDWEVKRDEFKDWYSDRPRERNAELSARFKDRRKSIDDFRSVVKGDTIISFTPIYPQNTVDRYFDKLTSIGNPETRELVKPVRAAFTKWIGYRNQIAAQMPNNIATSYRNQTRQLEKFYTTDEFLHEDEL